MRFGEYLVNKGVVERRGVEQGLKAQKYTKERLGRVLEGLGLISLEDLNGALQSYLKLETPESAKDWRATKAPVAPLPKNVDLEDDSSFVLRELEDGDLAVLSDRFCDLRLRKIEALTARKCQPILVDSERLALVSGRDLAPGKTAGFSQANSSASDDSKLAHGDAYTSLFRDVVHAAHEQGASDIHVEPSRNGVEVRFRVFGDMTTPWKSLDFQHRQGFINEVKRLVNLQVAVSGKPQDARVSYTGLNLDLRVNLIPTLYGERIVLRLLDLSRRFSMEELDIGASAKEAVATALSSKNGVVLISGPTGSGKTTTLYTVLSSLDRQRLNIVTIEDPIEYSLAGINQVGISGKLTFASALRAILRQDPDVILVGEIRDQETADLCFKAAATGHLVLSTVHANGAAEVVQRLLNLGVEKYLIGSCLRYSAAQRLAKKLCPHCSHKARADELPRRRIAEPSSIGPDYRVAGSGCEHCRGGFTGRTPVLEYMGQEEISQYAKADFSGDIAPRVSLKAACLEKARHGLIDITEVSQIA